MEIPKRINRLRITYIYLEKRRIWVLSAYKVEFNGCASKYGLLIFCLIFLGTIMIFVTILSPADFISEVMLPVFLVSLFMMPIGILLYSHIRKRLVIDEYGIRYWFGRKLKFKAYWHEIRRIENGSAFGKPYRTYLQIITENDKIVFGSKVHFIEDDIQKIYFTLATILSNLEHVEIVDDLNWYPERALISRVVDALHREKYHRLSVTMMI